MAIALVANTAAQGTTSGATTSGIDTTGANLLVVVLATYQATTEAAISDSKSNTWTGLTASHDGSVSRTRIFYCLNATVGASHTFTCSQASSFSSLAVSAWSGVITSSAFDVGNGANSFTAVTSIATNSVTPSENGSLLITGGCWASVGAPDSSSINNSFSVLNALGNVSGQSFGVLHGYRIQTTAAAVNPTISWTTLSGVSVSIATFKPAAPGGPFPFHLDSGSMSGGCQSLGFNRLAHKWPHWKTTRRASGLLLAQAG